MVSFGTKFWIKTINKKGAKERAVSILKIINKYNRKAKKILELGVGIGEVLVHFPRKYDLYGLDLIKEFVDVSKKRMPYAKFIVSSMHNFRINEKFDVIFSVHGCMNELENFEQWKSTFYHVYEHLNKNGLFIFDASTPKMLEIIKKQGPVLKKYSFALYLINPTIKKGILTWNSKIFEKIGKDKYNLHEDKWNEYLVHSPIKIKKELSKKFKILEARLMDKGEDIFFVCRKK